MAPLRDVPDTPGIVLDGPVDTWAPLLETRSAELAARARPVRLAVDLDATDELDGRALAALALAAKRLERGGGGLVLVCSRPELLRLLEVTGLEGAFELAAHMPRPRRAAVAV
jgi:anti-sigma B factor antagonist